MSNVHWEIPKVPRGNVNVTVCRDDGVRVSLAADDNNGLDSNMHPRTYLWVTGPDYVDLKPEIDGATPEDFVRELAQLMGHTLFSHETLARMNARYDAMQKKLDALSAAWRESRSNDEVLARLADILS